MRSLALSLRALLLVVALIGVESQVFADDTTAGNPFPADRPGKANGPFTVDEGRFAVESDFVNIINDHWAATPTTTRSLIAGDPSLKYGMSPARISSCSLAAISISPLKTA